MHVTSMWTMHHVSSVKTPELMIFRPKRVFTEMLYGCIWHGVIQSTAVQVKVCTVGYLVHLKADSTHLVKHYHGSGPQKFPVWMQWALRVHNSFLETVIFVLICVDYFCVIHRSHRASSHPWSNSTVHTGVVRIHSVRPLKQTPAFYGCCGPDLLKVVCETLQKCVSPRYVKSSHPQDPCMARCTTDLSPRRELGNPPILLPAWAAGRQGVRTWERQCGH